MHRLGIVLACAIIATLFAMPASAGAANARLDKVERATIKRINIYRKNKGLKPLRISAKLRRAAHWKARDNRRARRISHTDSRGRNSRRLMVAFGFPRNRWTGENLAAGHRTPKSVMRGWRRSRAHNRNLLFRKFRRVGIARVRAPRGPYRWYWALELGS